MISWGITQTNVFNCLRQACGDREFDVHSRWLTVYQMSSAGSKVAPGTMHEPLAWHQTAAWKGTGWKRSLPLGGSLREKQKTREEEDGEEEEEEEEEEKEEEEEETKTEP